MQIKDVSAIKNQTIRVESRAFGGGCEIEFQAQCLKLAEQRPLGNAAAR
jgi:hypothetical protein